MNRRGLAFLLVLVCTCLSMQPASAQSMDVRGHWESKTSEGAPELEIIVLDSDKGIVAASLVVAEGSCGGSIAGLGKISGKELEFSSYTRAKDETEKPYCSIRVVFDTRRSRARVIEGSNCFVYHGVACGFDLEDLRKK